MNIEVLDMPDVAELRQAGANASRGKPASKDPERGAARHLLPHVRRLHSYRVTEERWEDDGGASSSSDRKTL